MIIEEKNSKKERDAKKQKIKKLWEVNLHNDYEMDWNSDIIVIKRKGSWKGYPAAELTLPNEQEDIIRITFESDCEKDLEILRECLQQSKNKFLVEINNGFY